MYPLLELRILTNKKEEFEAIAKKQRVRVRDLGRRIRALKAKAARKIGFITSAKAAAAGTSRLSKKANLRAQISQCEASKEKVVEMLEAARRSHKNAKTKIRRMKMKIGQMEKRECQPIVDFIEAAAARGVQIRDVLDVETLYKVVVEKKIQKLVARIDGVEVGERDRLGAALDAALKGTCELRIEY